MTTISRFPTRMVYLKHDIVEIHYSGQEPSIFKLVVGAVHFVKRHGKEAICTQF